MLRTTCIDLAAGLMTFAPCWLGPVKELSLWKGQVRRPLFLLGAHCEPRLLGGWESAGRCACAGMHLEGARSGGSSQNKCSGSGPRQGGQHRMGSRGPGSQPGTPGRVGDGQDWVGVPMVGVAAASLGWELGRVVET